MALAQGVDAARFRPCVVKAVEGDKDVIVRLVRLLDLAIASDLEGDVRKAPLGDVDKVF